MMKQGFYKLTGVVLRRRETSEGDIRLYILFRKHGPLWVIAPGAARGRRRFGGGTEPLIWGYFGCYQSPKQLYLREIEVKEDLWEIRKDPGKLERAMNWARLLVEHLLPGYPCDEVLSVFYDSLYLLDKGLDGSLLEWRFLYRWMKNWGVAPDIWHCSSCGEKLEEAYWQGDVLICKKCRLNGGKAIAQAELSELVCAAALSRKDLIKWAQNKSSKANYVDYNGKLKDILKRSFLN